MTTPNIENIIKSLVVKADVMEMGEKIAWGSDTALMRQAAAALQTQAERIKELEAEIITRASYGDEQTDFAIKLAAERDALRAQLSEIEMEEPDIYVHQDGLQVWEAKNNAALENDPNFTAYFTRPMPAQPIIGLQAIHDAISVDPTLADCSQDVNAELVEALQCAKNSLVAFKLMPVPSNAWEDPDEANLEVVNAALSKYKGAK